MSHLPNRRILVIDDSPSIHEDFRKILVDERSASGDLDALRSAYLGGLAARDEESESFEVESAYQGQEGYEKLCLAVDAGRPYAVAFVDVRMPPGWDGVETIAHLWEKDPALQVVICTAYSDYSWEETVARLGQSDRLLILRKPFDPIEICQLASALSRKWNIARNESELMESLMAAEQEARAFASSLETVNRTLETAMAAAEKSSEMRSEFLVRLSAAIHVQAGAVLREIERIEAGAGEARRRSTLLAVGRRLMRTLDKVQDIALIDSGRLALEPSGCSPLTLAQDVLAAHRAQALEKGLALEVEQLGPLPLHIESDPQRIRQILGALLENAIQHTGAGFVRVSVGLEHTNYWDSPILCYEVRDTGVGISHHDVGRVFEPFTEEGGGEASRGTRLSLALAQRLARLLGGDLRVRSAPRQGSTFLFTLKLRGVSHVDLLGNEQPELLSPRLT